MKDVILLLILGSVFLSSCAREPELWVSKEKIDLGYEVDHETFTVFNIGGGKLDVKIEAEEPLKVNPVSFKLGKREEQEVTLSLSYRPTEDLKRKVIVRGNGGTSIIEVFISRKRRLLKKKVLLIDASFIISPREYHSFMFAVTKDMISPSLALEFSMDKDHVYIFLMDKRSYKGWVAGSPVDAIYHSSELSHKTEIELEEGGYYLVISNRALSDRVVKVKAILRYQVWE